ncbi:MAG: o-succinylbenzoate synthase, partial [Acidimicrobiia bacterium]|nr:o-succinylbenzoate synthase [Acidimicrobiia bacterium]
GRPMAVAAVEAALWDLHARQAGLPLAVALGGYVRPVGARAVLGVTDPTGLLRSAESAVAAGYRAIKAKIAPRRGDGLDGLRAAFPDLDIAADANGSFDPHDPAHVLELAALDRLGLSFIEQPFTRGDLAQTAALRATIGTPICLDEDVRSVPDAASVMKAGATDLLNLKSPRVGGHGPARRIVALSADAGIGVWWGGLLETGIGRAHAVAAATMVTQGDLPADLAASDRYYVRDVTEPWVLQNGALRPSDRPGIGVDVDIDALDHLTIRAIRLGDDHTAET